MTGNPTLMSLEQISPTRVIVRWSQPSGGAIVTGYVVHYKTATSVRTNPVSQTLTSTLLLSLTRGATYTISVEATSQHLSGESEKMNITLQLGQLTYIQQCSCRVNTAPLHACSHIHAHTTHTTHTHTSIKNNNCVHGYMHLPPRKCVSTYINMSSCSRSRISHVNATEGANTQSQLPAYNTALHIHV